MGIGEILWFGECGCGYWAGRRERKMGVLRTVEVAVDGRWDPASPVCEGIIWEVETRLGWWW